MLLRKLFIFFSTITCGYTFNLCERSFNKYQFSDAGTNGFFGYGVSLTKDYVYISAMTENSSNGSVHRCKTLTGDCEKINLHVEQVLSFVDKIPNGFLNMCTGNSIPNNTKIEIMEDNMKKLCDDTSELHINHSIYVTKQWMNNANEIIFGVPSVTGGKGMVFLFNQINQRVLPLRSPLPNSDFNGYFGYAVDAGFTDESVYIFSAPKLLGKVYIVRITNGMKILHAWKGSQIGDNFGSSILVEDFNNDGLADVAVGAPLHSKDTFHENGVVYIYYCLRFGMVIDYAAPVQLSSNDKYNGRFGTALSKIGDINGDGFNDIAISAPFENHGVVYLFHGGKNGISSIPVQLLEGSSSAAAWYGYSLSQGVDIDKNGFNDLLIGAPNSNTAYLHRSFPVVNIRTELITPANHIPNQPKTQFELVVCSYFETKVPCQITEIEIMLNLSLDSKYERLSHDGSNKDALKIGRTRTCTTISLTVESVKHEEKPMRIEIQSHLKKLPENANEFCEKCVVVDLQESKPAIKNVFFKTKCNDDGQPKNFYLEHRSETPYIINDTKIVTLKMKLENENSFISCTLPVCISIDNSNVAFMEVPKNCIKNNETFMECEYTAIDKLILKLDTSDVQQETVALSIGLCNGFSKVERKKIDINFITRSQIEIIGAASPVNISVVQSSTKNIPIHQTIFIHNKGPTKIDNFIFEIDIPIHYSLGLHTLNLIDKKRTSIWGQYMNKLFRIALGDSTIIYQSVESMPFNYLKPEYRGYEFLCNRVQVHLRDFHADTKFQIQMDFSMDIINFKELMYSEKMYFVSSVRVKNDRYFSITKMSYPETLILKSSIVNPWYFVGLFFQSLAILAILMFILRKLGFFKRNRVNRSKVSTATESGKYATAHKKKRMYELQSQMQTEMVSII